MLSVRCLYWQALRQSALLSQRENEKTARLKERLAKYTEYELEDVDNTGHCQFDAIAHQVQLSLPPSLTSMP